MIDLDDEVNIAAVVVLARKAKRQVKKKNRREERERDIQTDRNDGKSGVNRLLAFLNSMHVFKEYTEPIDNNKTQ